MPISTTMSTSNTSSPPSLAQLKQALQASWGPDTAFAGDEWTLDNPARNQCVPTALVVQFYLGGELEKLTANYRGVPESHYRNRLPDGSIVDFTRGQYPKSQQLRPSTVNLHGHASVREKMLTEPDTKRRYEVLLGRVEERLRLA